METVSSEKEVKIILNDDKYNKFFDDTNVLNKRFLEIFKNQMDKKYTKIDDPHYSVNTTTPTNKILVMIEEKSATTNKGWTERKFGEYVITFESEPQKSVTIRFLESSTKTTFNKARLNQIALDVKDVMLMAEYDLSKQNTSNAGTRKNRKQKRRSRKVKKTRKH